MVISTLTYTSAYMQRMFIHIPLLNIGQFDEYLQHTHTHRETHTHTHTVRCDMMGVWQLRVPERSTPFPMLHMLPPKQNVLPAAAASHVFSCPSPSVCLCVSLRTSSNGSHSTLVSSTSVRRNEGGRASAGLLSNPSRKRGIAVAIRFR